MVRFTVVENSASPKTRIDEISMEMSFSSPENALEEKRRCMQTVVDLYRRVLAERQDHLRDIEAEGFV